MLIYHCPKCGGQVEEDEYQPYCPYCGEEFPGVWGDAKCGNCGSILKWTGEGWFCEKCHSHPYEVHFVK